MSEQKNWIVQSAILKAPFSISSILELCTPFSRSSEFFGAKDFGTPTNSDPKHVASRNVSWKICRHELAMHEASNAIKNYSVWFWKVHGRVHFLCRVLKAKVFKHVKKGKCNHWGILTRKIAGFLGMSNSPASALFVDPMLRFFFRHGLSYSRLCWA